MLSEKFIEEFVRLLVERDAGDNIWRLCEMSAQVVVPRGEHHIDDKYKKKQETGDTKELAMKARKNEDTIGRFAFAWRQWERFLSDELYDSNGNELDMNHWDIRARLYYSHFAEMGRMVESGQIDNFAATTSLILAVENGYSVPQMVGTLQEILEIEEYFENVAWPRFQKKTRAMLKYPQLHGRRRKLVKEIAGTDWNAKNQQ